MYKLLYCALTGEPALNRRVVPIIIKRVIVTAFCFKLNDSSAR